MIIRFFYTLLLALAAPILLYSLYKKKQGKPTFGQRWKEHFGITPTVQSHDNPVWIHAVSVGEVIAAIPIVKELKKIRPEQSIVITTTTSTGAAQVEKISHLVEHRYMPIDFSFAVKGFLRAVRPCRLLIMETELWPNTLHTVASAGISITVLNARLSEKSYRNYSRSKAISNLLFKNLSLVCCQYNDDATRFSRLGLSPQKVAVTGSVKFDIDVPKTVYAQSKVLRSKLGLERPIWIAASTHKGEDEQILTAHKHLTLHYPNALLILVPRHPERFDDVNALCQKEGFSVVRRTSNQDVGLKTNIYLGDTMGELLELIGAADICFMGGSLIGKKVGGHNVLEPVALGIPTITGPSYYNFADIVSGLNSRNAIRIVDDADMLDKLLHRLCSNSFERETISSNALNFLHSNSGAIKKTLNRLGYE